MPALASCYFCGEAVGASLDEYDLPAEAPADEQVTVTLCARCEGKLSALLEELDASSTHDGPAPVFEADAATGPAPEPESAAGDTDTDADDKPDATETETDADDVEEPEPSEEDTIDPIAGDREPIFADDDRAVLDEELPLEDPAENDVPFAGASDADDHSEPDTASADSTVDARADDSVEAPDDSEGSGTEADDADPIAAPPASESDDDSATAGQASEQHTKPPTTVRGGDDEADSAPAAETAADAVDEEVGDDSSEEQATAVGVGADGAATTTESSTDSAAASADASSTTANPSETTAKTPTSPTTDAENPLSDVSPRTYNRVVRLLQNREFPVDRADFEALATSAYELDHGECASALDGAIEKGLLEERGGMLHRPE
ncbi:hypothetical protein [Salinarchaeum laminariae]|uniref:hypothetical protein n=1 Tax=Salinarchaeum laminariae TaxID=869888 RepID=UPI0020BFCE07|nr:hypothetical protein [Salinarchaeum laminariae]